MLIKRFKQQTGLSVIEIIIATALFIIMASSAMGVILGSFSTSRLGSERAQADFLAIEGIEATESIRNQNWTNLSNGTYGLTQTAGIWSFSGSSDISGKFTRVITINDVERDGNGDIISSGGTVDIETKIITSTINWDFTPTRSNSIQKELYLTNWQKSTSPNGGVVPPTTPPTPTPTPTASPSPSPSPSPTVNSCTSYCDSLPAYSAGTCRKNPAACNQNSETHEAGGDTWCTGGNNADTCCCL